MRDLLREPLIWVTGVLCVLLVCSLVWLFVNLCRFGV
jgi:hypothetical protein